MLSIPRRVSTTILTVVVSFVSLGVSSAPLRVQIPAQPARANTVDTGVINGAPYYIEIPAQWNKGLVLYTHGYTLVGSRLRRQDSPRMKGVRDAFLSRGFAFAASDYSVQGWAVKEAIEETEALRRYFMAKHGAPSETYITGHSMGGHITMAIIERYPEVYQGAMPMCGPLGAAIDFLNNGLFDMLVTFEAMFPGTIGSPYEPSAETGKQGESRDRSRPGASGEIRAALRAYRRPVAGRPVPLPRPCRRIETTRGRRALRQSQPHLHRLRRRRGAQSIDEALRRGTAAREYVRQYARRPAIFPIRCSRYTRRPTRWCLATT